MGNVHTADCESCAVTDTGSKLISCCGTTRLIFTASLASSHLAVICCQQPVYITSLCGLAYLVSILSTYYADLQDYAPALSSLTGDSGSPTGRTTGTSAGGIRGTINNAVEATKEYLPPQVEHCCCAFRTTRCMLVGTGRICCTV